MSRPFMFSASRGAFRPRAAGTGFAGASFRFQQRRNAGTITSTSLKSTIFRPITSVLLIAPLLTGYLGVWQVQRSKWKLALIDEVEHNLSKDPLPSPGKVNMNALPDFAFRRVSVRGKFTGPPILQGPQTRDGVAGYHSILPFNRSEHGGSTISVNRGFIKTAEGDEIRRGQRPVPGLGPNGEPGPEVVVEGMITKIDPAAKSYFTPENKPEQGDWFWKDIPTMTEFAGGEQNGVQPVSIDVIDTENTPASSRLSKGEPVGRPPTIESRNQHMTYAITWFSLCAATSAMSAMVIAKGRTRKMPARRAFGEKRR